jgi:hypothetical protein
MAPCNSRPHPQVPVTTVHLSVSYCWQCMAFSVQMWRHTADNDDVGEADLYGEEYLGPFDTVADAKALAVRMLGEALNGSGLPWDSGN